MGVLARWLAGHRTLHRLGQKGTAAPYLLPITLVLVLIGWVMFRAANVESAFTVYGGMLGLNGIAPGSNSSPTSPARTFSSWSWRSSRSLRTLLQEAHRCRDFGGSPRLRGLRQWCRGCHALARLSDRHEPPARGHRRPALEHRSRPFLYFSSDGRLNMSKLRQHTATLLLPTVFFGYAIYANSTMLLDTPRMPRESKVNDLSLSLSSTARRQGSRRAVQE